MNNVEEHLAKLKDEASAATAGSTESATAIAQRARKERIAIFVVGPVGVLLVVAAVLSVATAWDTASPERSPSSPSEERPDKAAQGERPPYQGVRLRGRRSGSDRLVPLVFATGRTTVVRYQRQLGIHRIGARPSAAVDLIAGDPPCGTLVVATQGSPAALHPSGKPLKTFSADGRTAELWKAYPKDPSQRYLMFRAGRWYLGLADTPDRCVSVPRNARLWVRHFRPAPMGQLVVIRGDVVVRQAAVLWASRHVYLQARLTETRCRSTGSSSSRGQQWVVHRSRGFARWCKRGEFVQFSADTTDSELLDRLIDGVSTT